MASAGHRGPGPAGPGAEPFDQDPRRWAVLALLSAGLLLGMSAWFTASAVAPELEVRWGLDPSQVGWLTTVVQLGFVAGTAAAALLNLADLLPSRWYFSVCALLAAASNASLLVVPGFASALGVRFLTGLFLAGVYPPAMKMIATWFRSARGLAIGTVVGALTVGKATPYLLKAIGGARVAPVVLGASAAGAVAALLVAAAYRDGPYPFARRSFSWGLVARIVRHRPTMLATGGYLGHMWELYAAWLTLPAYFFAVFATHGAADVAAFGAIAAGGIGAVAAGRLADAWGRERTAIAMMAVSASCALALGWMTRLSPWIVVPLAMVWGFSVVADSAQFSAAVTEVAPREAVGTALTLQTSMGFLLTSVSMQWTVALAGSVGWGVAYSMLAVGPALGIVSMAKLRAERLSRPPLRPPSTMSGD
jgi:MFS family permease